MPNSWPHTWREPTAVGWPCSIPRRRISRALPRRRDRAFAAGAVAASDGDGGIRSSGAARRSGRVHPAPGDRSHAGVGHRTTTRAAALHRRPVHRIRCIGGRAGPAPAGRANHRHRRFRCGPRIRAPQRRGHRVELVRADVKAHRACLPNSTRGSTWWSPTRPMFPTMPCWIPKWPNMIHPTRSSADRTDGGDRRRRPLAGRWLRPGGLFGVEHDDTTSAQTVELSSAQGFSKTSRPGEI